MKVLLAMAFVLTAAPAAWAGCNANVRMTNSSATSIMLGTAIKLGAVLSRNGKAKVKIRGGVWKKVRIDRLITPNENVRRSVSLLYNCNKKRRWQFTFSPAGRTNSYTFYFPSSSTWTESENIDLGDVSRFFD